MPFAREENLHPPAAYRGRCRGRLTGNPGVDSVTPIVGSTNPATLTIPGHTEALLADASAQMAYSGKKPCCAGGGAAKGGRAPEDDWFGISARSNASTWFSTGKRLSCENQHELCVYAHKYHRLLVIPQQPFDGGAGHTGADSMLGISFIPQHSAGVCCWSS